MPRKKKDGAEKDVSESTKSGNADGPKPPEEPRPEVQEPLAGPADPGTEPNLPANAPTVEKNRPPATPPRTRREKEARDEKAKKGGVAVSTDGRRARPPMKNGKVDLDQAETWSKNPKTGLLTYKFSNGAVVREDEL